MLEKITTNMAVFAMDETALAAARLVEIPFGELDLPDGRLVAMDPLVQPERPAFTRTVKPGRYPVSIIRQRRDYSRPAFLVIRFSGDRPSSFELALLASQDASKLEDDTFFGIPVDAGLAAFANSGFFAALEEREEAERKANAAYSNYYDNVIAEILPGHEDDIVALHKPVETGTGVAAISQAGWGDGYYPVIWGLGADGEPVLAFIDFFVIDDADGREDYEIERDRILSGMSDAEKAANAAAYEALKADDADRFREVLEEGLVEPKGYVIGSGGSFMMEAIRLDRPAVLKAMLDAGATDAPGAHDGPFKSYSGYARILQKNAGKEGKSGLPPLLPRSDALMKLIDELESR